MTRSLAILALLTSPALAQIPLEAIPLPGYGLGVDVDGDRMAVGEGGSVLVFELDLGPLQDNGLSLSPSGSC